MEYWGYFAGFTCFSECFLSIRDVVWLWALLVEWLLALLVEGCGLFACRKVVGFLLVERLWAFACRKVVDFACRMMWVLLVRMAVGFACS